MLQTTCIKNHLQFAKPLFRLLEAVFIGQFYCIYNVMVYEEQQSLKYISKTYCSRVNMCPLKHRIGQEAGHFQLLELIVKYVFEAQFCGLQPESPIQHCPSLTNVGTEYSEVHLVGDAN